MVVSILQNGIEFFLTAYNPKIKIKRLGSLIPKN